MSGAGATAVEEKRRRKRREMFFFLMNATVLAFGSGTAV
jgi:hypothetical protein